MSRIGRKEIIVPAGVTASIDANNVVTVKGSLGELTQVVDKLITVNIAEGKCFTPSEWAHCSYRRTIRGIFGY